jgi:hypothetical protein
MTEINDKSLQTSVTGDYGIHSCVILYTGWSRIPVRSVTNWRLITKYFEEKCAIPCIYDATNIALFYFHILDMTFLSLLIKSLDV